MQKIFLSLFLLFLAAFSAKAQDGKATRKLVVADMETKVPMRGVIVSTKDGYRDTTNWRGVCYVPQTFDTLTVAKANYIPERLLPKELKDSTFLIPAGKAIGEVTVWGKNNIQDDVDAWKNGTTLPLPDGRTGVVGELDFAKLLDARARRDRKHMRNVRRSFSTIDESEDPIVRAYNQAMAEEQMKKEQEEKKKAEKSK